MHVRAFNTEGRTAPAQGQPSPPPRAIPLMSLSTPHLPRGPGPLLQWFSRVRLSATPWTAARRASPSITISWSLLRLSVPGVGDATQPTHPLSAPSPPAFNPSQRQDSPRASWRTSVTSSAPAGPSPCEGRAWSLSPCSTNTSGPRKPGSHGICGTNQSEGSLLHPFQRLRWGLVTMLKCRLSCRLGFGGSL